MDNPIKFWENYLDDEDYKFLFNFIETIKHNKQTTWSSKDKRIIILCGKGGNGKMYMLKQIANYLKNEKNATSNVNDMFYNDDIQLFIDDIGVEFINDIREYDLNEVNNRMLIISMASKNQDIEPHIKCRSRIIKLKFLFNEDTKTFTRA